MNIRLQKEEIALIKKLALDLFASKDIWIFGSRINPSHKGGDIDIYLQTTKQDGILQAKIIFLREFEKALGEQKIDLLIDNNTQEKEIYFIAQKEGIKL